MQAAIIKSIFGNTVLSVASHTCSLKVKHLIRDSRASAVQVGALASLCLGTALHCTAHCLAPALRWVYMGGFSCLFLVLEEESGRGSEC